MPACASIFCAAAYYSKYYFYCILNKIYLIRNEVNRANSKNHVRAKNISFSF